MTKTMVLAHDLVARVTLDKLSKFALADLVTDLLRQNAGDENLDGIELARAVAAAFSPVAAARGDRVPNVTAIADDVYRRRVAKGLIKPTDD